MTENFINKIITGDCIEILNNAPEPFADLIFADPPFNIGYKYDKYYDNVSREIYKGWTEKWMISCLDVLKDNGSFYIAIGDDYVADVKNIADNLKLEMRNWIIWHYSFGQQMKNKFSRSHTHILYFVKDKKNFKFNHNAARIISDRQKKYHDKRANPEGKMPDDVWNEYPRLCGSFDEREGWHPCQMPESILARIIRVSSDEGDCVLDPFIGSGTTAVVAYKLKRNYVGIDISKDYVKEVKKRIKESKGLPVEGESKLKWTEHLDMELKWLYHENQIPTEQLYDDNFLLTLFAKKYNDRIGLKNNLFTPNDIKNRLRQLRKSAKLGPLRGEPIKPNKRKG